MKTAWRWAAAAVAAVGVGGAARADGDGAPPGPTAASSARSEVTLQWLAPASVRVGRPNPFTLTATNTSGQPVRGVTVQVRVPGGVTTPAAEPAAKAEGAVLQWDLGTMEPGQAKPIRLLLTPAARGDVDCRAWVTFTGTSALSVAAREPKLDVRVLTPRRVGLGDPVAVTCVVKNVGDHVADAVRVEPAAPADMTAEDASAANEPFDLLPGEEKTVTRRYHAARAGVSTFRATAAGADVAGVAAESSVVVVAPKLDVALVGPSDVIVGRKAAYAVVVRNVGEVGVENVLVREHLPAGFAARGYESGVPAMAADYLAPGDAVTLPFDAVAAVPGQFVRRVDVVGARGVKEAVDRRVSVDGIAAMRMEVIDSVDPVEKGGETTYEVRVTNTGSKADADVTVTCPLPPELAFVSATGPTGVRVEQLNTCAMVRFDPVRELGPQTEAVFRVRVKAAAAGDVRFKATLTSRHLSTSVVKEESTRVYGE